MTISQERREQLRATVYAAIQATTTGPFWPDMLTALDDLDAAEARAAAAEQRRQHFEQVAALSFRERDALQAQKDAVLAAHGNGHMCVDSSGARAWFSGSMICKTRRALGGAVLTDPPGTGDQ